MESLMVCQRRGSSDSKSCSRFCGNMGHSRGHGIHGPVLAAGVDGTGKRV